MKTPKNRLTKTPKDRRKPAVKHGNPAGALEADLKRQEAVRLRRDGHTFEEIGEKLEVSGKTAHQYVNDGWERIQNETDEERRLLRAESAARLRVALKRLMPIITTDNLVVVDEERGPGGAVVEVRRDAMDLQIKGMHLLIKIEDRLGKMFGSDAPAKVEVNNTGRQDCPTLEELRASVARSKANRAAVTGKPGDAQKA